MRNTKNKKSVVIQLDSVSKKYIVHHEKPTISEQIFSRRTNNEFYAIKDVSFSIYKGSRIGIIGRNGSGKTTLLKLISGITVPTSGSVTVRGKIVSLIDLEAGFHPDLSGEENIYLNGLLVGMTKREINDRKKKIIEFADIGEFIDAPLFTYSDGMKLRLGFSIGVFANPDILILDESAVVGDQWFQAKAERKITEMIQKNKTVVMVSHWLELLERNCDYFFWMEKGQLYSSGDSEMLKSYTKLV